MLTTSRMMTKTEVAELLDEVEGHFKWNSAYDVSALALKAFEPVTVDLAITLSKSLLL